MNKTVLRWVALAVVVLGAVVILARTVSRSHGQDVLVLSGGSFRQTLEDVTDEYRQKSAHTVAGNYGGSGEVAMWMQNTGKGDIFICHAPWLSWAKKRDLIAKSRTVGYAEAVIAVPKGNPANITCLKDLAEPGLRLGMGDPEYSTSGTVFANLLDNVPYGDDVRSNVAKTGHGHQKRCTEVALGSLDAGIVWNAAVHLFRDKLTSIPLPLDKCDDSVRGKVGVVDPSGVRVSVALTKYGRKNPAARKFYRFLADKGPRFFARHGFRPVEE